MGRGGGRGGSLGRQSREDGPGEGRGRWEGDQILAEGGEGCRGTGGRGNEAARAGDACRSLRILDLGGLLRVAAERPSSQQVADFFGRLRSGHHFCRVGPYFARCLWPTVER